MGGSSAQPQDVLGKYHPSQAVIDIQKRIILNIAARDIWDIGSFTGRIRKTGRTGTEIEREYSMKLLNDLEERLKPTLINKNVDQAKSLIKRLKLTLTKKGYCLEFENDVVTLDAFLSSVRKDFEREHPVSNVAWHCAKCGGSQYKLLNGEKQCESCFFVDGGTRKSDDRQLVKVQSLGIQAETRTIDFHLAKTKDEFIHCINHLVETSKLHLVTGRKRQEMIKKGQQFGVYFPPSPGWKQDLRYRPGMFNLFGFKTPRSTAEEYKILISDELRKQYHAELKKWHPDTAVGLSNNVASFWVELCVAVNNVLKNRKLNYKNGFLRAREDPMYLTRSLEEMIEHE